MTMTKLTEEEKRRLKNHANRNIAYLLDQLNVPYTDNGAGLIQAACPCQQHGGDGDNQTAWSWQIDIGKWVCWSHHCEEVRGNDAFGLVSSVLEHTFPRTVNWIVERLSERNIKVSDEVAEPKLEYRGSQLHIHVPLSEDNIAYLAPDPTYLLKRGFDSNVLRDYKVGYWNKMGTFMHDRVVFPVRDHEGHLVGYTGRTVQPKEYFDKKKAKYAKWVHGRHYHRWPQRGELFTGSILFNLHNISRLRKRLILVEGPLDGMKLQEAGIHNWIATFGTSFCAPHRTLLVQHGVTDLYVAYDNDENKAGEKGLSRLQRIVGDLFNIHHIPLPVGKDCGDLTVEELQELFNGVGC